jgi:hypothetical protein
MRCSGRQEEAAVDDRDRVFGLVGHKVAVALNNGVGIVAMLDEVRDDGVVLSEIGELGPGPTMFCPWDSLRRIRDRPPWLRMPHEEPVPAEAPLEQEFYELYEHREASPEEIEPYVERRRASARNLERVVPIGQRRAVDEVTVALTSLELFGEGVGVLRYRISYEVGMFEGEIPMPELVVRDESGRKLPWSLQGGGSSTDEADGEVEVRDLPEAGELEVEVTRLVSLVFDEETGGRSWRTPTTVLGPSGFLSSCAPAWWLGALARFGQDEEEGENDNNK